RRILGFAIPAGVAMAIVAVVVLTPPYARLAEARWRRTCLSVSATDGEALIAAQQRLIDAIPTDEVLTMRLAHDRLGLVPVNERAVATAAETPAPPPGIPSIQRHPRPDPPPLWVLRAARRLQRPPLRRGLMLLAGGMLVMAMLLSSPAHPSDK
ncbi:MAG: hypothetical protein KAX78_04985, partial [Phycisphaerae bacterium]|nr:hypothetical protein [Phycisphaerae bacterium]